MSKINQWRIFCNDENTWVYSWLDESSTGPVSCSNNTAHSVNLNSISIVDFISSNEVVIEEEKIKTQGHFRTEGYTFTIPPNTTYTHVVPLNYSISLLEVLFTIKTENIGDVFNAFYNPAVYGLITSDITSPTNVLNVNAFILGYLKIGFILTIKRESDNYVEDLGEVIAIDNINNTVTLTRNTIGNFVINDKVFMKINGVKNVSFGIEGRHIVGGSKIGASFLHYTGTLSATYENKSLTDTKTFNYELEYLY